MGGWRHVELLVGLLLLSVLLLDGVALVVDGLLRLLRMLWCWLMLSLLGH